MVFAFYVQVWLVFSLVHHIGANYMLRFLSRATLGSKGEVVDAGTDLSNSFVSELVFFGGVLSMSAWCTCLFFL